MVGSNVGFPVFQVKTKVECAGEVDGSIGRMGYPILFLAEVCAGALCTR